MENLIPAMKERRPRLDEHGMADYRNLGEVLVVHSGETLVRRIPATPGEAGGNCARPDDTRQVGQGGKVCSRPERGGSRYQRPGCAGRHHYRPTRAGEEWRDCRAHLCRGAASTCRRATSSIDGTVKVKGDVHAGMTIRATGDINIAGTVEAASEGGMALEAGGDIVVQGGVIGRIDSGDERKPYVPHPLQGFVYRALRPECPIYMPRTAFTWTIRRCKASFPPATRSWWEKRAPARGALSAGKSRRHCWSRRR